MTHAKPTQEELLAMCKRIEAAPHTRVHKTHAVIIARALKDRLQPSPPSVPVDREIGPSNIQERFFSFVTKPAWKSTDTWDAARQQVRDDMLEEIHAMLRSLKSSPATGKE